MKPLRDSQLAIRVNVTLDRESKDRLEALAAGHKLTVSAYLRQLIRIETRREQRRLSVDLSPSPKLPMGTASGVIRKVKSPYWRKKRKNAHGR